MVLLESVVHLYRTLLCKSQVTAFTTLYSYRVHLYRTLLCKSQVKAFTIYSCHMHLYRTLLCKSQVKAFTTLYSYLQLSYRTLLPLKVDESIFTECSIQSLLLYTTSSVFKMSPLLPSLSIWMKYHVSSFRSVIVSASTACIHDEHSFRSTLNRGDPPHLKKK
jgi:hypothetical protein